MQTRKPPIEKDPSSAFFFLLLYSLFVLIRPHEFSFSTSNLAIIKVLAIITLLLTIATIRPIKLTPQHWMVLSLIPLTIVSNTLNGWFFGGISKANILFVSCLVPFFLYSTCVNSIKRHELIMTVCLIAALFMVYNGYLQYSSFDGRFGTGIGDSQSVYSKGRSSLRITYFGFFGDPNDLGMFLVMNLPIAAYFFAKGNFFKKVIMVFIIACLLFGVYLTGSRGTLLGTIGVITVYFLITKGGSKLIIFSVLFAPLAATLLASFGGLSSSESSANGRLDAWYFGIQMLISHPLFGIGMGNYLEEHSLVAHNSYIHIASELGAIGYSLWGGVLILSMIAGFLIIKKFSCLEEDKFSKEKRELYTKEVLIVKTLFFSMTGFMITAFFLSRSYSLLLFLFLGLQTASYMRIIKINPELEDLLSAKNVFKCIRYSWLVIITVFVATKVGL